MPARARRHGGAGIRRGARVPGGRSLPLLQWSQGTFANASTRYIWDAAGSALFGPFAGGTPAVATIGGKKYFQSESAATNDIDESEDLTAWTSMGSESVAANAAVAPDGTTTADELTFTAASGDGLKTTIAGVATSSNVTLSAWVKVASGTEDFRLQLLLKDGTTATSGNLTATTSWQRFDYTANSASGGTTPEARIIVDSVPTAGAILVWGAQAEDAALYPSSYIPTAGSPVTRASDSMLFTAAQIPEVMREGKWKHTTLMQGTDAEAPPGGSTGVEFHFGGSPSTNAMRISHTTSGRAQAYDMRTGPTTHVISGACTWSRQQAVTTTWDTVAGSVLVEGATTGDGTTVGTTWSGVILGTDDLYVGRYFSVAAFWPRGLLSEPEEVA